MNRDEPTLKRYAHLAPGYRPVRVAVVLCLTILLGACASSFQLPGPPDTAALRARAESIEQDGIRVSAVIPDWEQSQAIFGVDLREKDIQPIWLEIRNDTDRQIYFLPTGLDPEYFSPREVAFGYHKSFSGDSREPLDAHIESLGFPYLINPHTTSSGFVFTNRDENSKFLTVDLIGRQWTKTFTLVIPTPDRNMESYDYERLVNRILETEWLAIEDEAKLRQRLEQLPCCAADRSGTQAEPLNIVLIGKLEDIASAFIRRNYRTTLAAPRYVFGRSQDIASSKRDRWVKAQPHVLRLWLSNVRFRGKPVWIGQVSTPIGGRFTVKSSMDTPPPIEPDVDESRNDLIQDTIYSQSLAKLGFVKGVGRVMASQPRQIPGGETYHSDGLRAVLFFEKRPVSLSQIEFFDWERLVDHYRKQLDEVDSTTLP